ncbi:HAAAP family serine/threonine permease [Kytococcus schroeteri]|uniref:HAAAP family serine/threonine permease n=1 Tax=Kytococcus schroeteri TaxID=138300 RepID=UPI00192D1374|nr:HAAAP family serine/threonine permease [Kytococcus schroeteri]
MSPSAGPSTPTRAARGPHPDGAPGRWTGADTAWVISLFGTAVGAGILFLPLNAASTSLAPLVVGTLLIGPMTYFAHRALSRLICAAPEKGKDITELARGYFGEVPGTLVTVLYWLCFYPIVLIYAVALTNTVDDFMVHQLGLASPPRWLLSLVLVGLMMAAVLTSQKLVMAVTQALVYPLIALLAVSTLLLVPHWRPGAFQWMPEGDFGTTLWMLVPTLVFAFNHSAAISQFSLSMQTEQGDRAAAKASQILRRTATLLTVFTMAFVWSSVLALGPDGLERAEGSNLSVLSYLAKEMDNAFFLWAGPIIAVAAIASSFFGHYLGAAEGGRGLVRALVDRRERIGDRTLDLGIAGVYGLTAWLAAVLNPTILDIIEALSGPVMAAYLYLMPIVAIHTVPALKPFRHRVAAHSFVVVMGLVAVSAAAYAVPKALQPYL